MKPSSQRALSFLISLLFLVGAVVIYGVFISPSNDSIQILRGQVVNKQTELKQQEAALKDLNDLLEKFHDLSSAQDLMSLSLPNDPNVSQLVNTINGLANLNSIRIKNVSVQSSVNKSAKQPIHVRNLGTARVSLSIYGTYDNLKNFISQIERNVRIMDIVSFNIVEEKTPGGSVEIRLPNSTPQPVTQMNFGVTLSIQAYFQEAPVSTPAASVR